TAQVPAPQNTLCVNAEQMSGSLMFVSFASRIDKFTFTGDAQIAHVAAIAAITLEACKGVTTGNLLIGAQATCAINYETIRGYCPADTFATQSTSYGFTGGNKFLIVGASPFGDSGDRWDIRLYSNTPGAYFTAAPTNIDGYTVAQDACTVPGLLGGVGVSAGFTAYNEGGTAGATYPAAGACTVATANRVRELRTATPFTGIHTFDTLELDIPAMAYDTAVIGSGTDVIIRVSFRKYPCGEVFSATRTIGTFVTTCPPAAAVTNLLFPFFPPMDGSLAGWWGGFLIVNGSTGAGTAVLTFVEADGDTGTFTTPSIAAGRMWIGNFATLLTSVTPNAGNTGTFGDATFSVAAACTFTFGGGFAFTGNGEEGTGYTAYASVGSGWN
ncbi:unnamed protein product, partial [marine sediment metagenome]